MRFLVDECAGPGLAAWLRSQGHEVYSVFNDDAGASDDDVVARAFRDSWILITNDKDFGEQIFRDGKPHHGIVLMRLDDERTPTKIALIQKLLENHADQLRDQFVVVTEKRVRFARSKRSQ